MGGQSVGDDSSDTSIVALSTGVWMWKASCWSVLGTACRCKSSLAAYSDVKQCHHCQVSNLSYAITPEIDVLFLTDRPNDADVLFQLKTTFFAPKLFGEKDPQNQMRTSYALRGQIK